MPYQLSNFDKLLHSNFKKNNNIITLQLTSANTKHARTGFLTCLVNSNKDKNNDTKIITLFDKDQNEYMKYSLIPGYPIPVFGCSVIQKLIPFIQKFGCIQSIKTNEPSINQEFNLERTEKYKYPCILSATFQKQQPVEL